MKKMIAVFALIISTGAFAQESIELNAEQIEVNASSATVVRTNKSPSSIELTFRVPMANSVCERTETRAVLRTSGFYCGYETRIRRISAGRVCTRTNPHNGQCLRFEETFREERTSHPRSCLVPESYCAQYGTATSYETDSMKIQFKDLPALGDSESETFTIAASQRSYDSGKVVYEVKALETIGEYKVTQKKFLFFKRDVYVVQPK